MHGCWPFSSHQPARRHLWQPPQPLLLLLLHVLSLGKICAEVFFTRQVVALLLLPLLLPQPLVRS
jgi:hypothetical protein